MTEQGKRPSSQSKGKSGGRWVYHDPKSILKRQKAGEWALRDKSIGRKKRVAGGFVTKEPASRSAAQDSRPSEWNDTPNLDLLHTLSELLRLPGSPETLARKVVHVLENDAGYDYAAVLVIDIESGLLRPLALSPRRYGEDRKKAVELFSATHYLKLGQGVAGLVAESGKTLCLGDIKDHSRYGSINEEIRSVLCVPLSLEAQHIGAILLESEAKDAYSELDVMVMETASTQLALAVKNAHLADLVPKSGNGTTTRSEARIDGRTFAAPVISDSVDRALRQFLERGPIVLYQAEPTSSRRMLFVSPQVEQLLGFPADKWTAGDGSWLAFLHPDDRSRVITAIGRGKETGRTAFTLEYRLVAKDGKPRWFRDVSTLMDAPDGQSQIWHGGLVEITMRREMEQALQEQVDELAEMNASLLYQNEELNAFSHTVAHDLQNPLSILVGFAEMLEREYAGEEEELLNQGVRVIAENGRRLQNIIKELLLLAEVRQLDEVDRSPLDMIGVLEEVRKRLVNMVEQEEATVIVPAEWPMAIGHAPWVEEVWVNYVSNAIKYGGKRPQIELGATPQSNGMIRFWVMDSGGGISREDQARLFKPFHKLNQARAQGHGLGLSIVQRIVTKLGGQVGVESRKGKGSRFWFTLPAAV